MLNARRVQSHDPNPADSLRPFVGRRSRGEVEHRGSRGRNGAFGVTAVEPARVTGGSPDSPLLTIDGRRDGSRIVLTASGEIDISSVECLQRALETARDGGASEIWLDLTATTFLDCTGLRVLREVRVGLLERNRRLVLIRPVGPVRRLLALTGADRDFEIHHTAAMAHETRGGSDRQS